MLRDIADRLGSGAVFVDVGANVGNHAIYVAATTGARVIAFEPNGELVDALRESIKLNGLDHVVDARPVAVGDAPGKGHFAALDEANLGAQRVALDDGADGPGLDEFPVSTLDSELGSTEVSVLKVDVEGMELAVIQGGRETLRRCRPLLYVEAQSPEALAALVPELVPLGYAFVRSFNATPTHLFVPVERLTAADLRDAAAAGAASAYRSADEHVLRRDLSAARQRFRALSTEHSQTKADLARTSAMASEALRQRSRLSRELANDDTGSTEARDAVDELARSLTGQVRATLVARRRALAVDAQLATSQAELEAVRSGRWYRVGEALRRARTSPGRLVKLPVTLLRIASSSPATTSAPRTPLRLPTGPLILSRALEEEHLARVRARFGARVNRRPRLRVAAITDDFTRLGFSPDCDWADIPREGWKEALEEFDPDLVFVESAWRGRDEAWKDVVHTAPPELREILDWARAGSVATVFWNKEDPVRFEQFVGVAGLFDFVFTTDVDIVGRYRARLGHDRVHALGFAVQPREVNPFVRGPRSSAIMFAGSYYRKYPQRMRDFDAIASALVAAGRELAIYDRNAASNAEQFRYPEYAQELVVGSLPADKMAAAYRRYRVGLTINTVKQSDSMFARRALELLASGTLVLSNYNRALSLLFGDVVKLTDDGREAVRWLVDLDRDPLLERMIRSEGLRRVMSEHTYADRWDAVRSVISGVAPDRGGPRVAVVLRADTPDELDLMLAVLRDQRGVRADAMVLTIEPAVAARAIEEGLAAFTFEEWDGGALWTDDHVVVGLAMLAPDQQYDSYHLLDLALGLRYADAEVVVRPDADDPEFAYVKQASWSRAMVRDSALRAEDVVQGLRGQPVVKALGRRIVTLGHALPDDVEVSLRRLRHYHHVRTPSVLDELEEVPSIAGRGWVGAILHGWLTEQVPGVTLVDGTLLRVEGLDGQPTVVELPRTISPRRLWRANKVMLRVDGVGHGVDVALVLRDAENEVVATVVAPVGRAVRGEFPRSAVSATLELRAEATGRADIKAVWHQLPAEGRALVPRTGTLVVSTAYPSREDLYKYMFVHSRVLRYRQRGVDVDVAIGNPRHKELEFAEFEGIEASRMPFEVLGRAVREPGVERVLVHFLNERMWEELRTASSTTQFYLWFHGSEIQHWSRRLEFLEPDEDRERFERDGRARAAFWERLVELDDPRVNYIFVSRHFLEETEADLGRTLPRNRVAVIHNPVDTDVFPFREKTADQRLRILSVRPYASRKYANDLAVEAVLRLAEKPYFDQLRFTFVGDGPHFDRTLAPLRGFANVTIQQGFLSRTQLAALYRENGVFLCPTRQDTQGVSRDEAMSSGMVPVTSGVSAVPEFVDEDCGFLAGAEDAGGLADGIDALYEDPDRFLRMSAAAAQRVRRQSDAARVIEQELGFMGFDL
ncbi:FkbM family methyltransferase [Luteimicrobium sp. NPDC057192]|uniref:FkbM family methyltransferase n=1 Tax=Luteimicrobium sp. NPDC057192 TaxID=3346042 RepID=UPI00363258EB